MENSVTQKWYNKFWIVVLFCLALFPINIFVLWKNKTLKTIWKIILFMVSPIFTGLTLGLLIFSYLNLQSLLNREKTESANSFLKEYLIVNPNGKFLTIADYAQVILYWEGGDMNRKQRIDSLLHFLEPKNFEIDPVVLSNHHLGFRRGESKSTDSTSYYPQKFMFGESDEPFSVAYIVPDSAYFNQMKLALINGYKLEKFPDKNLKSQTYDNNKGKIRFLFVVKDNGKRSEYQIIKANYYWLPDVGKLK